MLFRSSSVAKEFVFYGDNTIVENTGNSGDTAARTGAVMVSLNSSGELVDGSLLGTLPGYNVSLSGVSTTGAGIVNNPGTAYYSYFGLKPTEVDQIEVDTVTVTTPTTYKTNKHKKVITTHPIELDVIDLDTNNKTNQTQYAVVVPLDKDGFIVTAPMQDDDANRRLKKFRIDLNISD